MNTTTLQARLFSTSEYGFNNFIIYDRNYKNVYLEEIITTPNNFRCFEFNSKCVSFYKAFSDANITLAYFEYINGNYKFYDKYMNDITDNIPQSLINNLSTTSTNKIYRHRYIINKDMVLIRDGFVGTNKEVYKNKIISVSEFQKIYNTLPKRNFSFMEIVC